MATPKTKPAVKKAAAGKEVARNPATPKKQVIAQKVSKAAPPKSVERKRAAQVTTLSDLEAMFVQEYLVDMNGTQAYLRVKPGASAVSARVEASRLVAKPNVQDAIADAKRERGVRTEITADVALQHVWGIATADMREIVEYRVGCCRHCWGKNYGYQRTQAEFDRAEAVQAKANEDAVTSGKPVKDFDPQGGVGYDKRTVPNQACPECFGEGVGRTIFHDTRKLSPGAAALYAGVKETKDGIEIKAHSKNDALEKVMRHVGAYEKDNKQKSLLDGVSRETLKAVAERLSGKGG